MNAIMSLATMAMAQGDEVHATELAAMLTDEERERLSIECLRQSGVLPRVATGWDIPVPAAGGEIRATCAMRVQASDMSEFMLVFSRRGDGAEHAYSACSINGSRVRLTSTGAAMWVTRELESGIDMLIDASAAKPGDWVNLRPEGAETVAQVRSYKIIEIYREAELGWSDLVECELREDELEPVAAAAA
jgi:hypothetical protein